jgi:hypothetical protein
VRGAAAVGERQPAGGCQRGEDDYCGGAGSASR